MLMLLYAYVSQWYLSVSVCSCNTTQPADHKLRIYLSLMSHFEILRNNVLIIMIFLNYSFRDKLQKSTHKNEPKLPSHKKNCQGT